MAQTTSASSKVGYVSASLTQMVNPGTRQRLDTMHQALNMLDQNVGVLQQTLNRIFHAIGIMEQKMHNISQNGTYN